MSGNQLGKTYAAAAELAMHLTGEYPDWWQGRRWDRPVRWWCGSVTMVGTRDNCQRLLVGPPQNEEEWGTAAIPKRCISDKSRARGTPDALDTLLVRHKSGKDSYLGFKAYEQGRLKWQGESLDGVWFDEEPPYDIYSEGLTRTNATGGIVMITFTPLLGLSAVVRKFLSGEDLEVMTRKNQPQVGKTPGLDQPENSEYAGK